METCMELRQQRAKAVEDARALCSRADAEKRDLSAEEKTQFDELMAKSDKLAESISSRERLESHERMVSAPGSRVSEPLPHEVGGKHRYSLLKAIRQTAYYRQFGGTGLDGIEREVNDEIAARTGKKPQGFFMPTRLSPPPEYRQLAMDPAKLAHLAKAYVEERAIDTTAATGAVMTTYDRTWIELLRSRMVIARLGVRILNDMHGNFSIPRQTQAATAYWVAEGTGVTGSNQVLDQIVFTPRTVGAYTDMTRRFLEQLSIDAEMFVRQDLAAVIARAIETAVFNGSSAPQPTGILQDSSVPSGNKFAMGTNGGVPTWDTLIQMETAVAKANADIGNLQWALTPGVRGLFRRTLKVAGSTFPVYLMDTPGELADYPAQVSNLIPSNLTKGTATSICSAMIYGNWDDAILAFWSGLDVLVDPFTGGPAGTIRIVMLQDCDFHIRHGQSFAFSTDVLGD